MPTHTIRSSGGDYTSVSGWEATEQRNLVTGSEIEIGECYDDWASGLNDNFTISGWTTNSSYYVVLKVASGGEHGGIPQGGFYLKKSLSYGYMAQISQAYSRIYDIDLYNTNNYGYGFKSFGDCQGHRLIGRAKKGYTFDNLGDNAKLYNCLAHNSNAGFETQSYMSGDVLFYHCIAANNTNAGFKARTSGYFKMRNSVSFGNGSDYSMGSGVDHGSSYNATDAGTSTNVPGSNAITSIVSGDFNDEPNDDFHLASASSNLYHASANNVLSADVDGDTYDASTPSVGFDEIVSSGTTIDVPTGALGLTGYNPTVLTPKTVDVPTGSLTLSGYAPTPLTHVTVNIPVGNLSLAGQAPTVDITDNQIINIPPGAVGLTGYAPTPITHVTIDVPAAALGLTGYAPTVDSGGNVTIDIPTASLTLTGYAPTIVNHNTINVPTGNLTLNGYSPTVGNHITIDIPVGALTLTGFSPVVDITNHQTIDIPLGNLNLTGYAPTADTTNHQTINIPVGALTLTGYAPVIAGTVQVGKLVGTITLTPVIAGSIAISKAVEGAVTLNPVLDGEVTIN